MNRLYSRIIVSVIALFLIHGVAAQTPKLYFILNAPETVSQRAYIARSYILFKPGFSFKANQATDSLKAKIDNTLVFNVVSNPNPKPGETVTNGTDLPYIPGTSYGEDPVSNVKGVDVAPVYGTAPNTVATVQPQIYPVIWMKTVPKTNNLNGEYVWKDIVGNTLTLKTKNESGAWVDFVTTRNKMRAFNFNPAIDLSANTYAKKIEISTSNLAQATVIAIWGVKSDYTQDRFLMTMQGRPKDGYLFSKQSVVPSFPATPSFNYGGMVKNFMFQSALDGTVSAFHEKSLRIGTFFKSSVPDHSVWGETPTSTIYFGAKEDTVTAWLNRTGMQGYMPEMLIFSHYLRQDDILKYTSYLALKYGISLDTSYVSAGGDVIWDYTKKSGFNNRITGYGREDDLGFYQKVATTSYEESPYFADSSQYDSNDSADSYQPTSRYRLLTMGLQHANPINNGRYFIYGDNGGSLSQRGDSVLGYSYLMARKWRLQTNTNKDASGSKILSWVKTGQTITYTPYLSNPYRGDFCKKASSDSAAMVTTTPLAGKNGYFAWTIDIESGPLTVKFGTNAPFLTADSHDYGYRIDKNGNVSKIYKGRLDYYLFTVEHGQRIEVEKNERNIYLKVNGVRYKGTEFQIAAEDINKAYYGAVYLGANLYDFKLLDFRNGGFVNTGHRVELSYDSNRASVFTDPTLGKVYMLIDPTGKDNYNSNPVSYPCDEVDVVRKKLIFNNVYFDTNTTGEYSFTFAYINKQVLRSTSDPDPEDKPMDELEKDDIQIYSRNTGGESLTTVRIQLVKPSPSKILVFDLSGRRVALQDVPASTEPSYTDLRLPMNGVYIVKVITKNNHYTQEVLSK